MTYLEAYALAWSMANSGRIDTTDVPSAIAYLLTGQS